MRVFILYDENGEIVATSVSETLPEGAESPFRVGKSKHGVIELDENDPLAKKIREDKSANRSAAHSLHADFAVDPKTKKLDDKKAVQRRQAAAKQAEERARAEEAAKAAEAAKLAEEERRKRELAEEERRRREAGGGGLPPVKPK